LGRARGSTQPTPSRQAHAGPIWARTAPPPGQAAAVPRPHKREAAPACARALGTPLLRRPVQQRAGRQHRRTARAGELANRPRLTFEIRPPPSVSTVGEHVYAIPSISSLRFGFHPCPSSPVAPAICCARRTHCAPLFVFVSGSNRR
jgi:hypothetical protein